MYYRLASSYALRGWQNATGMLVKKPGNEATPLKPAELSLLVLCDGETPFDVEGLQKTERDALQAFIRKGIVSAHNEPLPLRDRQRYCYFDNRFIQSVMWSVTGACNARCRHCFVDGPCETENGLSTENARTLIDQMAQCGVMQVELTGGEPLLRPDFWQLVDRLCEKDIYLSQIYTNGFFVDEAFLLELEKRHVQPRLCFSFDGVDGWHDWMRGVEGAEEKTLKAMKLCIEKGFQVYAGMCLHKGNAAVLPDTVKRLAALGVKGLNISGITMSPLWQKNHEGNNLDDREYLEAVMAYFPAYFRDGRPMPVTLNGAALLHPQDECHVVHAAVCKPAAKSRYLCSTARFSPYISANGRLLPCMPMAMCEEQRHFPLILENGLAACLGNSTFMDFVSLRTEDLFARNETCGSCEHRYTCGGGCRAMALQDTHDFFGCDAQQCIIWKEKYKEKLECALEEAKKNAACGGKQ